MCIRDRHGWGLMVTDPGPEDDVPVKLRPPRLPIQPLTPAQLEELKKILQRGDVYKRQI